MLILTDPKELAEQCRKWRAAGESVALTPTMGFYHRGHEALIEYGRQNADRLVVSLFVNPAQFGPNEDLEAYPRDFERDSEIARRHGTDILFCPNPAAMYAPDHATWVEVPEMAKGLCGASRPVHFRGVCTVVLKLFMLTGADMAVFGQKDWQQQAIIKRMARDLNIPIQIISRPTEREEDGLALSSRNVYLTKKERERAPHIRRGLLLAEKLAGEGIDAAEVLKRTREYWAAEIPEAEIDYLSLVHPETLAPLDRLDQDAVLACAIRLGKARLIDNIYIYQRAWSWGETSGVTAYSRKIIKIK